MALMCSLPDLPGDRRETGGHFWRAQWARLAAVAPGPGIPSNSFQAPYSGQPACCSLQTHCSLLFFWDMQQFKLRATTLVAAETQVQVPFLSICATLSMCGSLPWFPGYEGEMR